jgi:hypothetical protein
MAKVFDKEPFIFTKEQVKKNQWFYLVVIWFFSIFWRTMINMSKTGFLNFVGKQ